MRPCIGIITQIDLCDNEKQIKQAEERLRLAGLSNIFKVSAVTGEGVEALAEYLNEEDN